MSLAIAFQVSSYTIFNTFSSSVSSFFCQHQPQLSYLYRHQVSQRNVLSNYTNRNTSIMTMDLKNTLTSDQPQKLSVTSTSPKKLRSVDYPYPSPVPVAAELQSLSKETGSVPEMWEYLASKYSNYTAVIDMHHGEKARMNFSQMKQVIQSFAAGLAHHGINPGDTVAVFSESSYKWLIADQALLTINAISAVRGIAAPVDELTYIFEHSDSVGIICENLDIFQKLQPHIPKEKLRFAMVLWGGIKQTDTFDGSYAEGKKILTFDDVLMCGAKDPDADRSPKATRSDVATLLYTSGTTGHPKGVMLTHGNLLHQVDHLTIGSADLRPGNHFVSILPCWHIFERTACYYALSKGACVVYSNIKHFKSDLLEHKPEMLVAVPRVYETLYNGVMTKIKSAPKTKQMIFAFFSKISLYFVKTLRVARGLHLYHKNILKKIICAIFVLFLFPLYALAEILIWSKIRDGIGGRMKIGICGGGSLNMSLENFFESAKLNIFVGYGLTETSPVIANRYYEHNVRGSTGMCPPGTLVKLVDPDTGKTVTRRGETGVICAKGPQVFKGYYKNEEATANAFDSEGYFNTGDLGWIGPAGDLVISGRLKDVIVLNNGENVEPQPIEDAILEANAIDQIMLCGQDEKHLGALVVPNLDYLEMLGHISTTMKENINGVLKSHPQPRSKEIKALEKQFAETEGLLEFIKQEISKRVQKRRNYTPNDRVQEIRIILTPFSVDNGMLTQTLKVKKNIVSKTYKTEIESLFHH